MQTKTTPTTPTLKPVVLHHITVKHGDYEAHEESRDENAQAGILRRWRESIVLPQGERSWVWASIWLPTTWSLAVGDKISDDGGTTYRVMCEEEKQDVAYRMYKAVEAYDTI